MSSYVEMNRKGPDQVSLRQSIGKNEASVVPGMSRASKQIVMLFVNDLSQRTGRKLLQKSSKTDPFCPNKKPSVSEKILESTSWQFVEQLTNSR